MKMQTDLPVKISKRLNEFTAAAEGALVDSNGATYPIHSHLPRLRRRAGTLGARAGRHGILCL